MDPVFAREDATGMLVAVSQIEGSSNGTILAALSDERLDAVEEVGLCIGCPSLHLEIGISPIVQVNLTNPIFFALGNNITPALRRLGHQRGGRLRTASINGQGFLRGAQAALNHNGFTPEEDV
jgi:hypothetical protein